MDTLGPMKVFFKQRSPFYRGWFVHKTINSGKQMCPLYRGVPYRECPLREVPLYTTTMYTKSLCINL